MALLAYVGFLSAFPVAVNRDQESVIYFTSLSTSGPPIWVTLPLIFLAVAAIMAGPGELVADCFSQLPRLDAYRFDLIGSLIGIVAFTICSFTGAPPACLVPAGRRAVPRAVRRRWSGRDDHRCWLPPWRCSPTRSSMRPASSGRPTTGSPPSPESDGNNGTQWQVYVNGIPHQRLTTAATRLAQEPFYDEPYRRVDQAARASADRRRRHRHRRVDRPVPRG